MPLTDHPTSGHDLHCQSTVSQHLPLYNVPRTPSADLPGGRPSAAAGSGLRLVLKVGLTPEHESAPATPPPSVAPLRLSMAAITEAETHRKEKKHKKKKKKDKERDREHRERHRLKKVSNSPVRERHRLKVNNSSVVPALRKVD